VYEKWKWVFVVVSVFSGCDYVYGCGPTTPARFAARNDSKNDTSPLYGTAASVVHRLVVYLLLYKNALRQLPYCL
jgi:hypothetical protein